MLNLSSSPSTFVTVFTASFSGMYVFLAVRDVSDPVPEFKARGEAVNLGGNLLSEVQFTVYLASSDTLDHKGSACTLYGVRIGDEL